MPSFRHAVALTAATLFAIRLSASAKRVPPCRSSLSGIRAIARPCSRAPAAFSSWGSRRDPQFEANRAKYERIIFSIRRAPKRSPVPRAESMGRNTTICHLI
jgi:hypothetical protein